MPGRPRKPVAAKRLKGRGKGRDSGGRPLPEEPEYSASLPKPPSWLKGDGLREWKRLEPKMSKQGVLTEADWGVFGDYCETFDHDAAIRRAMKTLKVGSEEWHKLDRARDRNKKLKTKLETELGLTPATRSKVSKSPKWLKPQEAADPMGKFKRTKLHAIKGGKSS